MTVVEEKEVMPEAPPAPVEQNSAPAAAADVAKPNRRKSSKSNRSEGGDDPKKSERRGSYVPYDVLIKQHEEALATKKVLETGVKGTVLWFSFRYHYGFISRDDGKGDVFVHQMNIIKSRMRRVYLRSLANNEKVEFDVIEGNNGPEAANVTGPDGADVQGFPRIPINRKGQRKDHSSESKEESHEEQPMANKEKSSKQRRRRSTDKKSEEHEGPQETDGLQKCTADADDDDYLVKEVGKLSGGDAKLFA